MTNAFTLGAFGGDEALLIDGKFRRAAELDASGLGARSAFAGSRPDQLALEFGQAAQHRQHQSTVRCRRVGPHVAQRSKLGLHLGDGGQHVEEIARRTRQPIQTYDDQDIPLAQRGDCPLGLGPFGLRARRRLAEDLGAARRDEW